MIQQNPVCIRALSHLPRCLQRLSRKLGHNVRLLLEHGFVVRHPETIMVASAEYYSLPDAVSVNALKNVCSHDPAWHSGAGFFPRFNPRMHGNDVASEIPAQDIDQSV